jgi:hypothetical protein
MSFWLSLETSGRTRAVAFLMSGAAACLELQGRQVSAAGEREEREPGVTDVALERRSFQLFR